MAKSQIFNNLTDLTFISSELCNLNCSYCEIAKTSTMDHKVEQEKIKKAFSSGEYVNRYKAIFNKYQIDNKNIQRLCLWGQEPTLTLNEFSTQIPDILRWLPNANYLFFSTNGVAYYDRIINLINHINNFIINTDRNFRLVIQFSLDSLQYNENHRGIKPEIIINNIKNLIINLNEINICKNFEISFNFHGVISFQLIHQSLQNNNIKELWEEMDELIKGFVQLNKNKQVIVKHIWGTGFQHPYNATSIEGKELAEFVQQSINLYSKYQIASLNPNRLLSLYIHGLIPPEGATTDDFKEDVIDITNYEYDMQSTSKFIKNSLGCGVGTHDIKMRYDGTLIYCQNLIFGLNKEHLDKHPNGEITYDIQKLQLKRNFSPNLFSSSDEDIERFIYTFDTFENGSLNFTIIQIINLMYILLQNNQIDISYQNDKEKILRHAIYLSRITQCWYDNISTTGTLHGRAFGMIRAYCNGFLDILEKYLEQGESSSLWK